MPGSASSSPVYTELNAKSPKGCERWLSVIRLVGIDHRPRRSSDSERLELFGDLPLGPVEAGEEDATEALKVIGNYGAIFELEAERRFNELCRHFEQRLSERDQLFGREPAMPFVHRFGERA